MPDYLADVMPRGQRAQQAVSFKLARAELRALGIILTRLPGEYRVNFWHGRDATAHTVETLDEALELGHAMAADMLRWPATSHRRGRRT